MENASNALIIAAGVLIGIIILSLAVYLFGAFGRYAERTQEKITENQLTQFNDKFLKYLGKIDLTIQDLITIKNYALENNNQYGIYNSSIRAAENNEYIDVYYKNSLTPEKLIFEMQDEELLKEGLKDGKEKKYTCTSVEINPNTKKVNRIRFREQP